MSWQTSSMQTNDNTIKRKQPHFSLFHVTAYHARDFGGIYLYDTVMCTHSDWIFYKSNTDYPTAFVLVYEWLE